MSQFMLRIFITISLFIGASLLALGQKSRVLSVFQMIETEKWEDAKEAIELASWNDKTSRWPWTFYAKGLLCQTAFEKGIEKNESNLTSLYPDQLNVAYAAYERALRLDPRGRTHSAVAMQYYTLANDFQNQGRQYFNRHDHARAMVAFENALLISKSPLVAVEPDSNLIYNTAVAAYEAGEWEKAIGYLNGLDDNRYSPNAALLLYRSYVNFGDSISGEKVLFNDVLRYRGDESIVLSLVDLLENTNRMERAIGILDTAIMLQPDNYHFPWTRGLVYQQMGRYPEAIQSLQSAIDLAPSEAEIYYDLAICFYNTGVGITRSSRKISNNSAYLEASKKAEEQFREAVKWLEKAHTLDPSNPQVTGKLNQLYEQLQMTEKRRTQLQRVH
jgi:tetratricopeptide (TPR) repeat protein